MAAGRRVANDLVSVKDLRQSERIEVDEMSIQNFMEDSYLERLSKQVPVVVVNPVDASEECDQVTSQIQMAHWEHGTKTNSDEPVKPHRTTVVYDLRR